MNSTDLGYLDRRQKSGFLRPLLALVLVTVIGTAVIYPLRASWGPTPLFDLIYLPGIVVIAIRYGFLWALATIVVSAATFDYCHIEPFNQLSPTKGKYVELLALSAAAGLVSFVSLRAYLRAVEIARNRRELLEADAVRRSDAMKTAILRAVSHEFRSPLTALSAALEVIGDDSVDQPAREEMVGIARTATAELRRLVDNVLDLARIEAGPLRPQSEWVSIEDVLARALAQEPDLQVRLDLGQLPLVRADPVQLERVFSNLLQNSRRHAAGLGVRVSGAVTEDGMLQIAFIDQGPGIAPSLGDAAFEPFRTGDPEAGTGLGLAIVRGFVEANGGSVRVDWAAEGASFVVDLPVEEREAAAVSAAEQVR